MGGNRRHLHPTGLLLSPPARQELELDPRAEPEGGDSIAGSSSSSRDFMDDPGRELEVRNSEAQPRPRPSAPIYPRLIPIPCKTWGCWSSLALQDTQQMNYSWESAAGALGERECCHCKATPLSGKLDETFPQMSRVSKHGLCKGCSYVKQIYFLMFLALISVLKEDLQSHQVLRVKVKLL